MNIQDKLNTIIAEIHRSMNEDEVINVWEWWSGVCVYGMVRAHENTGDERYKALLKKWVDKNTAGRCNGSVNRVIPCCGLDYLDSLEGTQVYDDICMEYEEWALNIAVIAENGGYAHVWGPNDDGIEMGAPEYAHQLWADSMMMACLFLYRYGKRKNMELLHKGIEQMKIHLDVLFDEEANLCYHAYDCPSDTRLGRFWARGNGWIVTTLAEMLRITVDMEIDTTYFENIFRRMLEQAYAKKAENGMLHTLIDHEEAYLEESGTLLFGYAALVGYELGILDEKYKKWAEDIADSMEFDEIGRIKYVSSGTGPESDYFSIPYAFMPYGSGLGLMLLTELLKVK